MPGSTENTVGLGSGVSGADRRQARRLVGGEADPVAQSVAVCGPDPRLVDDVASDGVQLPAVRDGTRPATRASSASIAACWARRDEVVDARGRASAGSPTNSVRVMSLR